MPTIRSQQQVYADLLDRYGQLVADAFMRAMEDLRSGAELQRVTALIQNGDIDGALEALHIDPEAFGDMLDKIREAHAEAGKRAAEALPKRKPDGTALVVRYDGRNPEAERGVAERGARLVQGVTDSIRQTATDWMVAGLARGDNPRTVALDLVGRVNRATGKREGGILGLTQTQAEYVMTARQELASGDPAALKNYLGRGRRDKRFDRSIAKAIREEKPVDPAIAAKVITAYERRLLQLRGEMISRTETLAAMNAASYEAIRQAVASGKIDAAAVCRVWRSAGDFRVRHTHIGLNRESVGLTQAFRSPSGALLRFPGDTSLGAPASEIVGCRCWVETRVDWLSNLK